MFPDTRRVIYVVARAVMVGDQEYVLWRPSSDGWEMPDREAGIGVVERHDHDGIRISGSGHDTLILRSPPISETASTPGRGLGAFWATCLTEGTQDVLRRGAIRIPVSQLYRASDELFGYAAAGHIVIAGREVPVRPGSAYTELKAEDAGLWVLGIIADTATPRAAGIAPAFAGVRVFSPEEWRGMHSPASPSKTARVPQATINRWMLDHASAAMPRKIKRADAVRDCMRIIEATHRQAIQAYQNLPESLRISQGRPKKDDR